VNSIAARPKATTQKRIFNFWNEKIYQTTNALEYQDSGNKKLGVALVTSLLQLLVPMCHYEILCIFP